VSSQRASVLACVLACVAVGVSGTPTVLAASPPTPAGTAPAQSRPADAAGSVSATAASAAKPPAITARAAILVEPDTQDVAYAHNANVRRPIASTTKLMTALLALERGRLDSNLTVVSYPVSDVESTAGLQAGERLSLRDLLRAMLLASANEAAQTVAVGIGGSVPAFVTSMNARAAALGLTQTHYATPVGLDVPGNYSTAGDLARLAAIDLGHPFFAATVNQSSAQLTTGARPRVVVNRNDLVGRFAFVDGVKTGHTSSAGYVLVAAARRAGVRLISVVLGDPSLATRDADTLALLRYGLDRYREQTIVKRGAPLAHASARYAGGEVTLVAGSAVRRVVVGGERATVAIVGAPSSLSGPLAAGVRVGTVVVGEHGRRVAEAPLVTARALSRPTLRQRLRSYFSGGLAVALLGVLVACSLLLVVLQRRAVRRSRAATAAGRRR